MIMLWVKDEIIIVCKEENQVLRKRVSKDGMIILGFGKPISEYGRKLKDVKDEIKSLVKKSFLETDAYISLASIKRISVVVSGEVNIPGPIKLSGTSSLLEALVYSGGITKGGSLRNITIIEGDKKRKIDLYPLIFGYPLKNFNNLNLKNNSIIIVPTIKNTVAISGNIKKPGIYELLELEETIENIIDLSGGFSIPGYNELSLQRLDEQRLDKLEFVSNNNKKVKSGDIIYNTLKHQTKKGIIWVTGQLLILQAFL